MSDDWTNYWSNFFGIAIYVIGIILFLGLICLAFFAYEEDSTGLLIGALTAVVLIGIAFLAWVKTSDEREDREDREPATLQSSYGEQGEAEGHLV